MTLIYKFGKGKKDKFNNYDSPAFIVSAILCGILGIVSLTFLIFNIPDTLLAIKFPEMFTIQSIIQKNN